MEELGFRCCFCGKKIGSSLTDPCAMNVVCNIDKEAGKQYNQFLYCHLKCLKEKVVDDFPLYLEHLFD